jgi:hypothetical protein
LSGGVEEGTPGQCRKLRDRRSGELKTVL